MHQEVVEVLNHRAYTLSPRVELFLARANDADPLLSEVARRIEEVAGGEEGVVTICCSVHLVSALERVSQLTPTRIESLAIEALADGDLIEQLGEIDADVPDDPSQRPQPDLGADWW